MVPCGDDTGWVADKRQRRAAKFRRQAHEDHLGPPRLPGQPAWIDPTPLELAKALHAERMFGSSFEAHLLREVLEEAGWDKPREEQGEPAWTALVDFEHILEGHAREIAQDLPSLAWLWYLRRAWPIWRSINRLATTAPYVARIAEATSAWSNARGLAPTISEGLEYPRDTAAARAVFRMRAIALLLYDLHGTLRWAGKGARVVAVDGRMPDAVQDAELRRFIRLYDRRVVADVGSAVLAKAALYLTPNRLGLSEDELTRAAPIVGAAGPGRFGFGTLSLGQVPLLLDATLPEELRWPRPLLDLIVLMWATFISDIFWGDVQVGHVAFAGTGYRALSRETALGEIELSLAFLREKRLGGAIPPNVDLGSAAEVFDRLLAIPISVWPPSVSPLRAEGDICFVDLAAATLAITDAVARPAVSGSTANVWSEHFERSVQAAIDETPWKPSATLVALRGRPLRRNGKWLTDIDAIGERAGSLLIVSCKGVPFSTAFDRGEHRVIRNFAEHVEESVGAWRDVVADLDRAGDNFDFSGYRRIVGVVVYPHIPWTTSTLAVRDVTSGLRAAVSPSELIAWCRRAKW